MTSISPELSYKLYSDEIIYRPPPESESILLQVAVGCSYSQCTFCREQAHHRFKAYSLAEIEEKIAILASLPENKHKSDLFLVGENCLVLPTGHLVSILQAVHDLLPQVAHINLYGRAVEILQKGRTDLARLKELGVSSLYVGIESGSDQVLKNCHKGETVAQMLEALQLLDDLGITYSLSSIIGLGGEELAWEHATQTAAFYNQVHPQSIRLMTLSSEKGTDLAADIAAGRFHQLPPWKAILEERLLLKNLAVEHCRLYANHFSNLLPLVARWTEDKELVLEKMDEIICSMDPDDIDYQIFDHMKADIEQHTGAV